MWDAGRQGRGLGVFLALVAETARNTVGGDGDWADGRWAMEDEERERKEETPPGTPRKDVSARAAR